jgi:hypothetical protein
MSLRRRTVAILAVSAALSLPACGLGQEVSGAQSAINAVDPAADIQAQSNLNLADVAARTAFIDSSSYAGATPQRLSQVEPSLQFVAGASSGPGVVSVMPQGPDRWAAAVLSTSGTCFYSVIDGAGTTLKGSAKAACDAGDAANHVTQQ